MRICQLLSFSLIIVSFAGCGVKGKPLPPLTTPPIGRGEPNFSKATEKVKLKTKPTPKDDFVEPIDFQDDREK